MSPRRSPDQTQISISLPVNLLARIDDVAALENRSRSNYIVTVLARELPEPEGEAVAVAPEESAKAAEKTEAPKKKRKKKKA